MDFFKQIVESNPHPVYVKNEQGKFVFANSAYAEIHGIRVAELIEAGFSEFDYSYDRDLEVLKMGEPISIQEFYKSKEGEVCWYQTIKKTFRQPDGARYLLSQSSDITDLKKTIKKAAESAKVKDIFLANMSWEIRTPIHAIIGIAKLLKKSNLNKNQEDYLNTILSISDNLLVTPNHILDYAEIESGEIRLEVIPFDVVMTVQDTVHALALKAKEQGLQLHFEDPSENIPILLGDPFRLSQVLVILINNAIKFTKKGEITVSVTVKEKVNNLVSLAFCVQDTGIGMSAETSEKIFGDYSPSGGGSSPVAGGSGLGLTICKNLIESQDGKIWIESIPGAGSRFYFNIPYLISESAHKELGQEQIVVQGELRGINILLAEDNQVNQLLTISHLESCDMAVDLAYDGEEALAKAQDKKYDLILMDIQMPKMDGMEATSRIRKNSNPNQHTPIIAFTANTERTDVKNYRYQGFTDIILKPYHKSKLYLTIANNTGRTIGATSNRILTPINQEELLYDFSGLGSLASDQLFIRKMQRLFIETVPEQLNELKDAIDNGAWDAVAYLAHRLKSTYGNIKVKEAAEAMKKIESLAQSQTNLNQINTYLQIAKEVTEKVLAIFKIELQNLN